MNIIKNGHKIPNDNELRAQSDEGGVLRALPLSPEEAARENQSEARRRAAIQLEKGKQSAWTHAKLDKLALDGGVKKRKSPNKNPKEYELPVGGITEDLDSVDPIIFERLGEPREFTEDINLIKNGYKKEKLVVEGNEMQAINPAGEKYLLGLLIRRHIFDQGYSIFIGENDQPILRDERPNPDSARKERMKGLQDALGRYEFSKNTRNPLSKDDNTSLLAEYIAAETYAEKPNLVDHRNALANKVGIISPTISPEQAKKILESTSLNPQEKSFLLAWKDTGKDKVLTDIQSDQEKFVKNARENFNQKSPEMNRKELIEQPFTKIPQLLMVGAVGVGLLLIAAKQWKKGGIWGSISALILGLIGFSVVSKQADGAWKKFGLGEKLNDVMNEGKPTDRADANDNPFANIDKALIEPIQKNWANFQARTSGASEGINILMNDKVGQKIATEYPVYSMLGTLNDNERTSTTGKYRAPDETGTKITDIQEGFKNLKNANPSEKAQLNTLLRDTWERYQETEKFNTNGGLDKAKTTSLADMLAAIETEDGWFNKAIDAVSYEPEKQKALRVIGQNPKEWGNCTLGELESVFMPFGDERSTETGFRYADTDLARKNTIRGYLPTDGEKFPDPTSDMVKYLKVLGKDKLKEKSTMKLRDFLIS